MNQKRKEFLEIEDLIFSKSFRDRIERLGSKLDPELVALYENLDAKYKVVRNNIDFIPDELFERVSNSYIHILNTFTNIFHSIENGQFPDRGYIKTIVPDIRNKVDNWWSLLIPYIQADISLVNKLKEDLESEKAKAIDANSKIEELKIKLEKEIKDFQERYNESFRDAELEKQSSNLAKESQGNIYNSRWWLLLIFLAGIAFVCVFYCLFKSICFEKSCFINAELIELNKVCPTCGASVLYYEIVKAVLFRVIVLSTILYVITFAVKNYNAAMHNYTINAHRANALDAAQRLIGRANTDGAKDEILKLAAQAIFAHQKTGHLDKEAEPSNPNPIIEKIIDKATIK